MPRTKFIKVVDAVSSGQATKQSIDIPVGRYAGLLLRITGTTDTGQTLSADDVGDIRLVRHGTQKQGESFGFYHRQNNLHSGFMEETLPTADATAISAMIPFQLSNIPNTMDVRSSEELDLNIDFGSNLPTRFGTNAVNCEVYGIPDPLTPEIYELLVREQDIQVNAATTLSQHLDGKNTASIYLENYGNVDKVQLDVDDQNIVDNVDPNILKVMTNLVNQVESASNIVEINMSPTGEIVDTLNENANVKIQFSGGTTLNLTKFQINWNVDAQTSINNVNRLRQQKYSNSINGASIPQGAVQNNVN